MSHCKSIMIQGTCSNAGKSLITAGLCRIFSDLGLRVAPFKSQNMALNSYVTENGEEIGRAQALQAQASRISVDVRMNPILLKPTSDQGSQVIVMGKVIANMKVAEYIKYKEKAWKQVTAAYNSLASESDIIVLEGAGSPAEINLRKHDIVNMRMAKYAKAPVLLVGDIDRGGVFASLVGTMELLTPKDKEQVAGFIINKFRGVQDLLDPALIYTSKRTHKRFFGIVPYIADLNLPEEDSVNFKSNCRQNVYNNTSGAAKIEIGLIDLPYISNFTDFDPFKNEPDVHIKIIRKVEDLASLDIIILPGSKNTCADLQYLHESGLAAAICKEAEHGKVKVILGICAGLQILGMSICDPHHVEIKAGSCVEVEGLGLLPLISVMGQEKTLKRTKAIFLPSGHNCQGYEIHHGQSYCKQGFEKNISVCMQDVNGQALGWQYVLNKQQNSCEKIAQCQIWGTYLHGLFEDDIFRHDFINSVLAAKKISPLGNGDGEGNGEGKGEGEIQSYSVEPSLNHLAKVLGENLDMKAIYKLLGL